MAAALIAAGVLGGGYEAARFLYIGPVLGHPKLVSVRRGETVARVADRLARERIIRSAFAFRVYARITGKERSLLPGDYLFPGKEPMSRVLDRLVRGESLTITVTIPEGFTVEQIAQKLAAKGLGCEAEFLRYALDSPVVRALTGGPGGAEGFLFPATYRFGIKTDTKTIVFAMLERFFKEITPAVIEREFELGLTNLETITLASMIEKEAKLASERKLIAGVFYNRLRRGMPLQSDPTAEYNSAGAVRDAEEAVHTVSAYNTYDFAGLPPGPIANPGWPAIAAALYPATTDFLYFVARGDGSHVFSRSLKEHNRAISRLAREERQASTSPHLGGPEQRSRQTGTSAE